jgi:uncharacterized RDD family membrane protein YckC
MLYFIGRDGKQLGPFTETQVQEKLEAKQISLDDLIWHEGMPGWQPVKSLFKEVPDDLMGNRPLFPPPPAFGGGGFRSDVTREPAPVQPALAGRGKRLIATSLDHLVLILGIAPFLVKFMSAIFALQQPGTKPDPEVMRAVATESIAFFVIPLFILALVQLVLLCTRGQTIGKIICKIRIVRVTGEPAGFVHAFLLRSVVMSLCTSIPIVGPIAMLVDPLLIFRDDRRCIHDLLAGTIVVDA